MGDWRTIQGCPVHKDIAPYIAIIVNDARATVNSIYRGQDAAWILHKHGKHTQAELYQLFLEGKGAPANSPGHSTHELRSDGVAYPIAYGHNLSWWQQGFDVNDVDILHCKAAARKHGWMLFQPYHSGAEYHHLNFYLQPRRPRPGTLLWARLWRLRFSLPRS